jgi:CRISPR-associated endonuclease/helicase Cas3
VSCPVLLVAGLAGEEPPTFGKPLWWGSMYSEDLLLRTWCLLRHGQRCNLTFPDEIDTLVHAVYEEEVDIPEFLRERMEKALVIKDGAAIALKGQANRAIIGLPDDASWNQPERFILYDEDEPGVHRTVMAHTRLGEDAVVAVPLTSHDSFDPEEEPGFARAKELFLRSVSLSRKGVVKELKKLGVPEGWKKSSLLRNCIPLMLNSERRWIENTTVRLDDDLGIVYETREAE